MQKIYPRKHGMRQTRFYSIWRNILKRCDFKKYEHYHRYGGRGITYDPRWKEFVNFYTDMFGTYQEGLSIDRVDNDKNYCKENCIWATQKQQCNNRSSNRLLTLNGDTKTLNDWAQYLGINRQTISQRIDAYGWSIERALSVSVS